MKRIAPDVVEAWQKAGARIGRYETEFETKFGHCEFFEGELNESTAGLPAFLWRIFEPGVILKLPAPFAPFALDLRNSGMTDRGLNELAGLKSFRALDLSETEVTDAGLKELAGLASLQYLDLCGLDATDAWLRELAGLKSLQMLYVGGTYHLGKHNPHTISRFVMITSGDR